MKIFGIILAMIAILALLVGLAFLCELGGLKWSEYFGPKREDVRRKVFQHTRSYNEAKQQDLVRYRMQYMQAKDVADKRIIADTIRMAFADYDESLLRPELRAFLETILRGGNQR
jgi:hypothetical protein